MAGYLSEIFNERPKQWGFRGDPYFWSYLEEYFSKIEFPYSESRFVDDIYRIFAKVSGTQLQIDTIVKVEEFAHGGMSSGGLSGKFWIERGIPLLVDRYREIIKQCE